MIGNLKPLGLALLGRAQADLYAGVHEDMGPNDGTRIREYLATFGLNPPAPWCAAAVGTWLHEAAIETGIPSPITGSASALATGDQLKAIGRWEPIEQVTPRVLVPGNLLVWVRGDNRPCVKPSPGQGVCPEHCKGHIAVIEKPLGVGTVQTIEANSGPNGDRVARRERLLSDPKLLGVGVFYDTLMVEESSSFPYWSLFPLGILVGWAGVRLLRAR